MGENLFSSFVVQSKSNEYERNKIEEETNCDKKVRKEKKEKKKQNMVQDTGHHRKQKKSVKKNKDDVVLNQISDCLSEKFECVRIK